MSAFYEEEIKDSYADSSEEKHMSWFHKDEFKQGLKDSVPVAMGYLAVSFTLGIAMRNAGISAVQGLFMSLLNSASAGEYAGILCIAANSSLVETALFTLVANARYLLLSTAMSQRLSPETKTVHRVLIGSVMTDELFGLGISRVGYIDPSYQYGAILPSWLSWGLGTMFGVIAGSILPTRIVSALSVALYGMFLAIIIPPSKKDKVVGVMVVISFVCSYIASIAPWISQFSEGTRTLVLTIILSTIAAILFPRKKGAE